MVSQKTGDRDRVGRSWRRVRAEQWRKRGAGLKGCGAGIYDMADKPPAIWKEVICMKTMKALAVLAAALLAFGIPAHTLAAGADASTSATPPDNGVSNAAAYAAPAFSPDTAYPLEEMLNYALLEEYATEAAAAKVIARFGGHYPFMELQELAAQRILLLKGLFESFGFALPVNNAADSLKTPSSLSAAYGAGLAAETRKIQMYQAFLAQDSLPDGVRAAFEELLLGSVGYRDIFGRLAAQNAQKESNDDRDDDEDDGKDDGHDDGRDGNDNDD